MSVVSQWKNNLFALPLCDPLDMIPVMKSALPGNESCPRCLSPFCEFAVDEGLPGLCSACAETAFTWVFSTPPAFVSVSHDETEDSCLFIDEAETWELDTSAGTLTLNGTDVWTAENTWRCLASNVVFNQNPPEGYNQYMCVMPTPTPAELITFCQLSLLSVTGCTVLPRFYTTEISLTNASGTLCGSQRDCATWADSEGGWPQTYVLELQGLALHPIGPVIGQPDPADDVNVYCQRLGATCGWSSVYPSFTFGSNTCGTVSRLTVSLWLHTSPQLDPTGTVCEGVADKFGDGIVYAEVRLRGGFGSSVGGPNSAAWYSGTWSCSGALSLTKVANGIGATWPDSRCDFPASLTFTPV